MKNPDKTYTLTYFGKEVGHISRITYLRTKERAYRGISVHGEIKYASSLEACRKALLEAYH
jgi:hypothetical protein